MSQHLQRILPILLIASAVQCIFLMWSTEGIGSQLLYVLVYLVLLGLPLIRYSYLSEKALIMLLVTGSLGGLGMITGAMIDAFLDNPLRFNHSNMHNLDSGNTSLINWSNGLMLAICIPSCWHLCPHCKNPLSDILSHTISTISMFIGMLIAGNLLVNFSGELSSLGGMHLAMLAGMLAGTAVITPLSLILTPSTV